jgi:hypothetical protein
MENLSCIVVPTEDGYDVHSSTQWMDLDQIVVARTVGVPVNKYEIVDKMQNLLNNTNFNQGQRLREAHRRRVRRQAVSLGNIGRGVRPGCQKAKPTGSLDFVPLGQYGGDQQKIFAEE